MPWDDSTFPMAPKKPSGGTANPPTPWMGSAIIAATSPEVVMSMSCTRSSTHAVVYASSSRWRNGLRSR